MTKRVIGKNLFSLRSFWSNCRSYVFVWSSFTTTDLINYNIIGIPQRVINIFFFATKYDLFGLLEKPRLMVIFHWLVYLFVSSTSLQSCIVLLGSQTAENKEKSYAIKDTLGSKTASGNWKTFKNDEICFLFHVKSSSWPCGYVEKQLVKKAMVNFWCHRLHNKDYNAHIVQYLKK